MRRDKDEPRRDYYPCQNCRRPVYRNKREYIWLHAQTGRQECRWVAEPDVTVPAEHGFPVDGPMVGGG